MEELKNKLIGQLSNYWTLLVLGNILYLAIYWRFQRIPTWKDLLRAIPATIINFVTFYIAPTLSRVSAQWLYKFWNGEAPSWPPDWMQYRYNETKFLEYAANYGTVVVLGLGLKLSFTVVEGTENLITNTSTGLFNLFKGKKTAQPDEEESESEDADLSQSQSDVPPLPAAPGSSAASPSASGSSPTPVPVRIVKKG